MIQEYVRIFIYVFICLNCNLDCPYNVLHCSRLTWNPCLFFHHPTIISSLKDEINSGDFFTLCLPASFHFLCFEILCPRWPPCWPLPSSPSVGEDGLKKRKAPINVWQSSAEFHKVRRKSQLRSRCRASGGGGKSCPRMPGGARGGW